MVRVQENFHPDERVRAQAVEAHACSVPLLELHRGYMFEYVHV